MSKGYLSYLDIIDTDTAECTSSINTKLKVPYFISDGKIILILCDFYFPIFITSFIGREIISCFLKQNNIKLSEIEGIVNKEWKELSESSRSTFEEVNV